MGGGGANGDPLGQLVLGVQVLAVDVQPAAHGGARPRVTEKGPAGAAPG